MAKGEGGKGGGCWLTVMRSHDDGRPGSGAEETFRPEHGREAFGVGVGVEAFQDVV